MKTWCPLHFDPVFKVFGNTRGLGYAAAVLVDTVRADPAVQAALQPLIDGANGKPLPSGEVYLVLSKFAPFCCYLGDQAIQAVIEQAKQHVAAEAN